MVERPFSGFMFSLLEPVILTLKITIYFAARLNDIFILVSYWLDDIFDLIG